MNKTWWLAVAMLVGGCSNGNKGTDAGVDAGLPDIAFADVDMAQAPDVLTGTRIAMGMGLQLFGVTDDDFVLYSGANGGLKATPIAGGKEQTIDAAFGFVSFTNKLVFTWDAVDMTANTGALNVWTAAGGLKTVAMGTGSSTAVNPSVSKDGSLIFYSAGGSAAGDAADLYIAKADGTMPKKILSQKASGTACASAATFTASKMIVSYCEANLPDAGTVPATVAAVDTTTGAVTTLMTNTQPTFGFLVNDAGTFAFSIDNNQNGLISSTAGGAVTTVDTMVMGAILSKDSNAVVYRTMGGALKRVAFATPGSPTILVASKFLRFDATSNDRSVVLTHSMENAADPMAPLRDLFAVGTETAGAPVALDPAVELETFGDAISADNSRAVFFTDLNNQVGTLKTVAITGGAITTISPNVWDAFARTGTKYIFNNNYNSNTNGGRADLQAVDIAGTAAPTLIANQADQNAFYLSHARDRIAYFYDNQPDTTGIYIAPLP